MEQLLCMALTRMGGFNFAQLKAMYDAVGSATMIFEHRNDVKAILEDATPRLCKSLKDWSEGLKRAEAELEFITSHNITALTPDRAEYPQRLKDCPDAPLVLYYKGKADLNAGHVIDIIGTRHCTSYGKDLIQKFVRELKTMCPDTLIVSGLAYGVDICAHRAALENGMETVGVLAHGLDNIYPYRHRDTAVEMVSHGGLLTEFMSQTNADKVNFIRRNRIVAGMSDATILVESAEKGGGLITLGMANTYNREAFAFPGPVGAEFSTGCNRAISRNEARLLLSAEDFVAAMGWQNEMERRKAEQNGIERQLFPDITEEERPVVELLQQTNDLQANMICVKTGIPIQRLLAIFFQLEMKGMLRPLAGGTYHLITN